MKIYNFCIFVLILFLFSIASCNQYKNQSDPLPSWNETPIKQSIFAFVNKATIEIPIEDRIAVFDMDGTIACEKPLWYEMYAAVNGLNQQSAKNPSLLKFPEYLFAQKLFINPGDTSVTNNWITSDANFKDSMVWKAYEGFDHEVYIDSAKAYLSRTKDYKFNIFLSNMFYQPMLELIQYLKENQFSVYVVSGSIQGVIWSVCPQTLALDRSHLIGTRQIFVPIYNPVESKTSFVIKKGIFLPIDNNAGKSLNIYSYIGKVPVFAFGNTTGDFEMLHLTSTNKYPHAEYLLNHDDSIREYAYPPYYGKPTPYWKDSLKLNKWNLVNMSEEFKTVWKKK